MMKLVTPAPSKVKDLYYQKWDRFYCCYQSHYNNLGQQWPKIGSINGRIKSEIICVPYDDIKFNPLYNQFTLEEHLEYARQTEMFVIIDKTFEHVHDDDDITELHANLKKFGLLERCIVFDNTYNENLFDKHGIAHIYFPGYVFFYVMQRKIPKYSATPTNQFLCLNNYHKIHRLAVIYKLKEMNVLKRTAWSYRSSINDASGLHRIIPSFDRKILDMEFPKYLDQDATNFDQNANLDTLYENAMSTIVTETDYFYTHTTFATEKSLLALFFGTVPVFVSCPGTVNMLREQSLDVYDDMLDHSYDEEQDPIKRFEKIGPVIEQVASWRIYSQIKSNLAVRSLRNQMLLTHQDHWIKIADHCGSTFFDSNKISI